MHNPPVGELNLECFLLNNQRRDKLVFLCRMSGAIIIVRMFLIQMQVVLLTIRYLVNYIGLILINN